MTDFNNKKNISGAQFTQQADDFQVRSASAAVGFEMDDVQPPSALYIGVDDQIQIAAAALFNGNTAVCTVRILRVDGVVMPLVFTVSSAGNNAVGKQSFQLIEGYLLSVGIVSQFGTGNINPCYASAQLVRTPFTTAQSSSVLCSGYINSQFPIGYPEMAPRLQTEGQGWATTTSGLGVTVPGAGADWIFTVRAGLRVLIKSISALFTTAVAVANRNVNLQIDDGANIYASIPSGFSEVASLANRYTWMDGAPAPALFDNKVTIPIPANLILPVGHRISSVTTGIQAADQWSGIVIMGQVWLDQN